MDGFFVAKIKVGKRTKKAAADEDEEKEDATATGSTIAETSTSGSVFNAPEDEALIAESKRKDLLKRKGIKIKPQAPKAEAAAEVKAPKVKKGKKVTEQRRPKKA